jgi:hypothetical protein
VIDESRSGDTEERTVVATMKLVNTVKERFDRHEISKKDAQDQLKVFENSFPFARG